MPERDDHLATIRDPSVREAYAILEWAGLKSGHRLRYTTPPVSSVDFFDNKDDWVHSFTINRGHLLFYIRDPALHRRPSLKEEASAFFVVARNRAGEGQIYIRSARDARAIAEWFFS